VLPRRPSRFVDYQRQLLDFRSIEQGLDGPRQLATPVRMLVDGPGQIHLLHLAEQIFELDQEQPRGSPSQEAMRSFGEPIFASNRALIVRLQQRGVSF
jgi:hypothetical protein